MLSKIKTSLLLFALALITHSSGKTHILSLDAEGQLGVVQMFIVDYFERAAYDYARKDLCIDERANGRIAMPELFDVIAGTQSGAIAAAILSVKNNDEAADKYKFYAKDVQKLFQEQGEQLFVVREMPKLLKVILVVIVALIGLGIGKLLGWLIFLK